MRRLEVFETTALQQKDPEAPVWMEKNAMNCLVWMVNEINRNVELLDNADRFYERESTDFVQLQEECCVPESEKKKICEPTLNAIPFAGRAKRKTSELSELFRCLVRGM